MKSIDKLRESLKDCTIEAGIEPNRFDTYWITAKARDKLIDEVEAEIERDYMRLPVDADGVLIDLGDKLIEHEDGHEFIVDGVKILGSTYEWWAYEDGGILAPAMCCTHVKQRTPEDVLRDVWQEALDYAKSDMWRNPDEVFAERADEIRELLGGDAR